MKKRLKKVGLVATEEQLIQHLMSAIEEKSYFDLTMAVNLITNNKEAMVNKYGFDIMSISNLYSDVIGEYMHSKDDQSERELPEWCIEILKKTVSKILFKKNTMDAFNEASENLNQKDNQIMELKKEIDKSIDDGDKEKFKELTDKLRQIEGKRKILMKNKS